MRRVCTAVAAIAWFGLFGSGVAAGESLPRLDWVRGDGTIAWSVELTAGDGPGPVEPSGLSGPLWFPPVPDVRVELIGGGGRRLRDFDGKALLLAFWAVWCEPCAEELPMLQALQEAERENGLDVLTVNVKDSDEAARQFAWALDLRMPIARYSQPLDDAFHVRALPTTMVFDRHGRLRRRWSTRRARTDQEIAEVVRTLLDDAVPQPEETVAQVLSGRGRLDVRWTRGLPASMEGLAPLRSDAESGSGFVAVGGRELVVFDSEGLVTERRPAPHGSGRLRAADRALIGFRRGATRVVRIDPDGEPGASWEAPAPVLDIAFERGREGASPALLLATTNGLHRVGLDGTRLDAREELGTLRAVAATRSELWAVLDVDGRLTWLNGALETVRAQETSSSSSSVLVSARGLADGVGVASVEVTSASVGRFLDGDAAQVALVVSSQLVVLDLASGAERFRARWPDLGTLAAIDLDGDGRHELIVSSGRRLTCLGVGEGPALLGKSSP